MNLNPGSKPTTTDVEACSNPRTDYKVGHHPVGRKSSRSALSVTADRPSLSRDRQLPGRPLTRLRSRYNDDEREAGPIRYATPGIGQDPQGSPARPDKNLGKEVTKVCNIGTDVDDADEAYSLRPPALTDSEHDSESEVGPDENDDPLITTLGKEGPRVMKVSDIPVEKVIKIGSTVSNRIRPNTFQPLGRALSRAKTYLSTSNSKETIAGHANKNQIIKTERECTSDPCVKKGTEFHKMILPEATNSKDEIMTASKVDQEHIAERIDHWSCKADDISEKVSLNTPQSSDLLVHKGTRKKIITKDGDTYPCKEREEITDADSLATLESVVNEAQ